MFRTDAVDAVASLPAPEPVGPINGYFDKGDPQVGRLPTVVSQDWLNAVQEEIVTVIQQAGIALDNTKTDFTQLYDAIISLINSEVFPHTHDASEIVSGTFDNARIAQGNVTQHQAALAIAETQITDGSILARVGAAETISQPWLFGAIPSTSVAPTSGNHLTNKTYVDGLFGSITLPVGAKAAGRFTAASNGTSISLVANENVSSVTLVSDDGNSGTTFLVTLSAGFSGGYVVVLGSEGEYIGGSSRYRMRVTGYTILTGSTFQIHAMSIEDDNNGNVNAVKDDYNISFACFGDF